MSNKMKKKQIENQAQDGRSMVEMLGVLAIIGVLSIGGIAGYRMAMNRYQANQIANEINLMRTDAKMKVARGVDELLLGEPYDGEGGHLNFGSNYGVKVAYPVIISGEEGKEDGEEGYSFTLSGISAGVCKPLTTLLWSMNDTASLKVNEDYYGDESAGNFCNEDENKIEVAFSTKDIGVSGGANDESQNESACPGCQGHCTESGQCIECPADAPWNQRAGDCVCTDSNQHWNGNTCLTCPPEAPWDGKRCMGCSGGKVLSGGECVCPTGSTLDPSTEECACNPDTPRWTGTECTECPEGMEWIRGWKRCKCETDIYWQESIGECKRLSGLCQGNVDCDLGEYCHVESKYSCSQEFDSENFGGKYQSYSKCKKAIANTIEGEKSGYVVSKDEMNWWSAQRFCAALGRLPATRASIGCGNVDAEVGNGFKGEACTSETIAKLKEDFNFEDGGWLEDYVDNCNAYQVIFSRDDNIHNTPHGGGAWTGSMHALCQ